MPLLDKISLPLTAAENTDLNTRFDGALNILVPKTVNLSAPERKQYGSINEKNKLVVQKVELQAISHPNFKSAQVNWTEFASDNTMRKYWEILLSKLDVLRNVCINAKILYDNDAYNAALIQYNYMKYLSQTGAPGADQLFTELKQFFEKDSSPAPDKEETINTEDEADNVDPNPEDDTTK